MKRLSHLDRDGRARMVDVSAKRPTRRQAQVQAVVRLSPEAFEAIQAKRLSKGDPFTVAKIAGIQAAKRTADLIPLCHPLPIEQVDVSFEPDDAAHTIRLIASARTTAKTGIEMEAFTAAAVAALTLYDMVKAVDPAATITDLQLLRKTGGKQGFERSVEQRSVGAGPAASGLRLPSSSLDGTAAGGRSLPSASPAPTRQGFERCAQPW